MCYSCYSGQSVFVIFGVGHVGDDGEGELGFMFWMGCFDSCDGGFGADGSADVVTCFEESGDDLASYEAVCAWKIMRIWFYGTVLRIENLNAPVTRTICSDGEAIAIVEAGINLYKNI